MDYGLWIVACTTQEKASSRIIQLFFHINKYIKCTLLIRTADCTAMHHFQKQFGCVCISSNFSPPFSYTENYVNVPPLDPSLSPKIHCTYFTEVGLLDVMLGHCVRTRLVAREMQTSCLCKSNLLEQLLLLSAGKLCVMCD